MSFLLFRKVRVAFFDNWTVLAKYSAPGRCCLDLLADRLASPVFDSDLASSGAASDLGVEIGSVRIDSVPNSVLSAVAMLGNFRALCFVSRSAVVELSGSVLYFFCSGFSWPCPVPLR